MKQSLNIMAAAVLSVGAGAAFAASSVDLSVTGSITPAACTPALGNNGVVDHGKISVSDLNPVPYHTVLPTATITLGVSCAGSTLFAIKSSDNRAGSSGEQDNFMQNFGLGLVNGDKKVGWYLLKMTNALADGVARPIIESTDGKAWLDASAPGQVWQPNWMRAINGATTTNPVPLPLQDMKVDILVETTILRKDSLPIAQDIPLDGSATLDVVYL